MQCVLTPSDSYLPLPNEEIAKRVDAQVRLQKLYIIRTIGRMPVRALVARVGKRWARTPGGSVALAHPDASKDAF